MVRHDCNTFAGPSRQCSERLFGTATTRCCKLDHYTTASHLIKLVTTASHLIKLVLGLPGPRGRWGHGPRGTVAPKGPNPHAGPHHDGSHTRPRRPRRAGWCSSIIQSRPGLLQPLPQPLNRGLPALCLLQVVECHPLTIEASHTVGVGLEFEPAVDIVLDAFVALVIIRSRRRVAPVPQRPWDDR